MPNQHRPGYHRDRSAALYRARRRLEAAHPEEFAAYLTEEQAAQTRETQPEKKP